MLSLIVAYAKHRVIGKANDLPWYLPADLKHFKELTSGHSVILGRKTYESIVARLGKPLPNRTNIVITRDKHFAAPGAIIVRSPQEAIERADSEEVFVIGGASIYEAMLPLADRIYLTEVEADIEGDTYFPELGPEDWEEAERVTHEADERNEYDYAFIVLNRVKA